VSRQVTDVSVELRPDGRTTPIDLGVSAWYVRLCHAALGAQDHARHHSPGYKAVLVRMTKTKNVCARVKMCAAFQYAGQQIL